MKKILCVHQGSELYGSDRSFLQSVEAIRNRYPKDHIDVIVPSHGPLVDMLAKNNVNVRYLPVGTISRKNFFKNPLKETKTIFSLLAVSLREIRSSDVVYLNTIVVFAYILAAVFSNTVVIHHVREVPKNKIEKVIFSLLLFMTRGNVIFNSVFTKNCYFVREKKAYVVHNGVPAIKSQPKIMKRKAACLNILVIGRINGWKGQDVAIKAMYEIAKRNLKAKLRLVGSTPANQEYHLDVLSCLVKQYQLENNVEIIDFTPTPSKHYNWADIVVVPSKAPEPFGRVAIEAMSAGCVVCASNLGGLQEIFAQAGSGSIT